ncbi:MAG: alpha 1,2-mannosyltransferase 2.4.1 [Alyxoria varia]|nr:MAG: alpha 1,2-mannosyltransferase 2.4.1 [Alyxoria varia]
MAGPRYVRYIAFALFCLIIVYFISSSSPRQDVGAPGITDYKNSFKNIQDKFRSTHTPIDTTKAGAADEAGASEKSEEKPVSSNLPNEKDGKSTSEAEKNKPTQGKPPMKKPGSKGDEDLGASSKMNATFVTLARNSDVWEISKSIRTIEDRFNRKFNYDWVFLNDKPFDEQFKKVTTALVSGKTRYGLIPEAHWSFPEWIDTDKAAQVRKEMAEQEVIYGDSISYRHMCRYESGFFFRHPLMLEYEWYWRVEPSVELYCDINYDTFEYMANHNKAYSFVISLFEYEKTIPTIWDSTKTFMNKHPEHLAANNAIDWLSEDGGETYNRCHFWSNFEIGNLNWLRSDAYIDFFNQLDKDGGFFYERWGDAPVHSIAAGLLLDKKQIHFFNDIAYYHVPFTHCPTEEKVRLDNKCHCEPDKNFDWNGYSCTGRFYDTMNWTKPEGYDSQTDD